MLLELFGGRRKKGTASLLLLLVWCLGLAGGRTLCMGAPGGLYRPTPRGYNGNPTGRGAQPSVTALAGFCAGCWGPPTGGSRRLPAPWSTGRPHCPGPGRRLVTVALSWRRGLRRGRRGYSAAARRAIAVASPRLVSLMGRLLRGRRQAGCGEPALSWADWLEAWPPSGVSLPEGAHHLWATLAARRG